MLPKLCAMLCTQRWNTLTLGAMGTVCADFCGSVRELEALYPLLASKSRGIRICVAMLAWSPLVFIRDTVVGG